MRSRNKLALALLSVGAWSGLTYADSITPPSYTKTLAVGESDTVHKVVHVSQGEPTTSKVDVYFLADTTGSMGPFIGAVQGAANSILTATAALGDVAFGVGEYKDVGDTFAFRQNAAIGGSAAALAGIGLWGAAGGGDYPEAGLFGLHQVATGGGFRAGSERILVWFGDAPGHDPSNGITEAGATADLVAEGIAAQAINVGSGDGFAPFGAGHRGLNDTDQASRIAAATGGAFLDGINAATIVATISAAITTAVATYTTVSIDTSEVPPGVGVGVAPSAYVGSFDRSIARNFDFDVTFTGLAPGDYSFNIYGTVDGGRVGTEADRIHVPGTVPDGGSTLILMGLACSAMSLLRRK